MKQRGVIFDLFGTLVDFLPHDEYTAIRSAMAQCFGVSIDDFNAVWNQTLPDRDIGKFGGLEGDVRSAAELLGLDATDTVVNQVMKVRLDRYLPQLEPRAGAVETLSALKAAGYKIGIITACAAEVPILWEQTPFAQLVDEVVFSCIERCTKPDKRIYHIACQRLGLLPEQCLYIGDGSYQELAGAGRAGMYPVLIQRGTKGSIDYFGPVEEWTGPAISNLSEVLPLVRCWADGTT